MAKVTVKIKGGTKLLEKIKKQMKGNGLVVTAGFYKGSTYPDKTPVALVAYVNNYGTVKDGGFIPPRPFFSDAVRGNKKKWSKILGKAIKSKNYNYFQAGTILGMQMQQDIQESIDKSQPNNPYKENAPSTLAKSHNPNKEPLKDTFHMRNSVNFKVILGKKK